MALRQDCQSYQLVKSLYSIANGGFGGTGLGKGTFTTPGGTQLIPERQHRLHLLGARAGARPGRRLGAAPRVHGLRRARHEDRAPGRRRLLEAARRRAHLRLRAADVRDRRRHPAADPADRDHASRSSPTAARRSSRTSCCSRGSCSSPTGRTRPREPPDLACRARRARPARRADRRDDLLADLGRGRPRRARGQRDPARRAVRDRARADLRRRTARRVLAANVEQKVGGQTLYFRTYPNGGLASQIVGYSTQSRSRAGLERAENSYLTGVERRPRHDLRHARRPAEGDDDHRQQPRADDPRAGPAARRAAARGHLRRRGRARTRRPARST